MADRQERGIDQQESLTIFNKVLGIGEEDPRTKPENNQGDYKEGERFVQKKLIHPREVKLYRQLMMEANA